MSKLSKSKARTRRRSYAKPSAPRVIGANDNHGPAVNDNIEPVTIRGLELTDNQAYRFHLAGAKLTSADLAIRRDGHRMLEALDREVDARLANREADTNLQELRGLEALRGFDIGVSMHEGSRGAPRATRDGLETMLTKGSLSLVQHAAGLRYRIDYEMIDPEKALMPPSLDVTAKKVVRGGDHWADKRREIEERIFTIHLMICGVEVRKDQRHSLPRLPAGHPHMRQIHALTMIAGKGKNLSELNSSGRASARMSADLQDGLDVAAIVYGLA